MPILSLGSESRGIQVEATGGGGGMNGQEDKKMITNSSYFLQLPQYSAQ